MIKILPPEKDFEGYADIQINIVAQTYCMLVSYSQKIWSTTNVYSIIKKLINKPYFL